MNNEGCLNWGREGEGCSAQIQYNRRHWQEGAKNTTLHASRKKTSFVYLQVRRKSTRDASCSEAMVIKGCLIFSPGSCTMLTIFRGPNKSGIPSLSLTRLTGGTMHGQGILHITHIDNPVC